MINPDVQRLRDEVRKRRSAVTGKVGRIRRTTGVDITGTNEDPRRPPRVINKYSRPQLVKYLNALNAFQDRGVGFVAAHAGALIPKRAWQEYKRAERQYNKLGEMHLNAVGDIKLPDLGVTVRQHIESIHPRAEGAIVNRPFVKTDRAAKNVKNAEKLKELTADMKRKLQPGFLPGEIKKARRQLKDMLKTIGANSAANQANNLTDNQFNILWNYTNFATNISQNYSIMKARAAGDDSREDRSMFEDNEDDLRELFDAAEEFPKTSNSPQSRTRRK